MTDHLRREIDQIKKKILTLSTLVEENLQRAVLAFTQFDTELASTAVDLDEPIDELEVDLEEEILKVLALHQPVAMDLRLIVAVLKINNDLERIGDLAVTIARRARSLTSNRPLGLQTDLADMARRAQAMLNQSIDALVNLDTALARQICQSDRAVDEIYRACFSEIKTLIADKPEQTDRYMGVYAVARCLERIADHATNIAEDVIYMIEGEIIRHKSDSLEPPTAGPAQD